MYYGNPSASSASDGDATFEFFDDFEGDSLNTSKWPSIEGYTPTYSVSNSELYIEPTQTGWTYFISNYQWSAYPMRFIFKAYTNGYYSSEGGFGIIEYYDSTSSNAGGQMVVNQDKIGFLGQPSTDYNDFGTTFTDYSTYHTYKVVESSTTNREISTDTGVSYTGTKDYGSMTKKFIIGLFRQKTYYDYVFVTKYADPEPSVSSFGSEESAPGDSCSCPGLNQNWQINLADNCTINSDCDLGTGNLSFTGEGDCYCNATINASNLTPPLNSSGTLWILSNCRINIG